MQMARMSMSDEEFKQHQKMKRLEAEAQEEVNNDGGDHSCDDVVL